MWWCISDIVRAAHIKELQKEIFVIGISVSMPALGLNLLVNRINLVGGYMDRCKCYDSLEMGIKQVVMQLNFKGRTFFMQLSMCYTAGAVAWRITQEK